VRLWPHSDDDGGPATGLPTNQHACLYFILSAAISDQDEQYKKEDPRMIIGNLQRLDMAMLPAPLLQLLSREECSHQNLLNKDDGKYDIIDDAVFYLISSPVTADESNIKSEFHEQYLDIQILLTGQEIIATSATISTPHDYQQSKPDLIFVENDEITTRVMLEAGDFAIFYPGEVHRPTCQIDAPDRIKKAVFKISKTWLASH
jgi:biofilm protein TabA